MSSDNRLRLQKLLEKILGSRNVYYRPPESVKMNYPAIVYQRSRIDNAFADNLVYKQSKSYTITVIDQDPDSVIVDEVSKLPRCSYDRHFKVHNLNHDVFTIIY